MTFFTPFLHFNMNPVFAIGNYFGACLNQRMYSSAWEAAQNNGNNCNSSSWGNAYYPQTFSAPVGFWGGFNFSFPQMNYNMNLGFNGSVWASNANTFNMGNVWGNFGGWTFNAPIVSSPTKKRNLPTDIDGYNPDKGNKLARDARAHAVGFTHHCAGYVCNALERTHLDDGMGRGDAYQMPDLLRRNRNFKEVSVDSVDWRNLPAGCILCFNKGSQGYSKEYGHVEISMGDGTAVSDGTTRHIKKPDAIFVPV